MVAVSLTLELVAASTYCVFGARMSEAARRAGLLAWIMRILGGSLVGFGILMAAT